MYASLVYRQAIVLLRGELAIHDGGQASRAFLAVMFGEASARERQKVRRNLEAYCTQDTLALLDILGVLKQIAGS